MILGTGSYGIVLKNPLMPTSARDVRVVDIPYALPREDDIGKLIRSGAESSYRKELAMYRLLRELDPNSHFTVSLKGAMGFAPRAIARLPLEIQQALDWDAAHPTPTWQLVQSHGGLGISSGLISLTFAQLLRACAALLDGLAKLHARSISHNDLHCDNLLVPLPLTLDLPVAGSLVVTK